MPKKKTKRDRFADLTWNDMGAWAGSKILSRGRDYQRQGRVSDMAVTEDDGLIAWVDGTIRYATKVTMDKSGLPNSICTCPYEVGCKHGVAVVVEYLKRLEDNRPVPGADRNDARLMLLAADDGEDDPVDAGKAASVNVFKEIGQFLKGKTKAQLVELIHEIAQQHPDVAQTLADRRQLAAGQSKTRVARLRREIKAVGDDVGWQNYWQGDGHTPDYSGIRRKLEALLTAGHADEVLTLGRELVSTGIRQVEESHDEGETEMAIAACMPVLVKALDRSSLDPADKLNWALDATLQDAYEVCGDLAEYLHRKHPQSAWNVMADRLLRRLKEMKTAKGFLAFSRNMDRDRLSDWAIHALDRAGREAEIIPLCEVEAGKTENYKRLVDRLVAARRYEEAEHWIGKGIRATKDNLPGIADGLRQTLQKIRTRQKNWPAVAAIKVEAFVRYPSRQAFTDCKTAAEKVKAWPEVREALLAYLEKGEPPWKREHWPLPKSGLDAPETGRKREFPMVADLIGIAIVEKAPERILFWYDRLPEKRYRSYGVDDNEGRHLERQSGAPDRPGQAKSLRRGRRLLAQGRQSHGQRGKTSAVEPVSATVKGTPCPQNPPDGGSGWPGRQSDHKKEALIWMRRRTVPDRSMSKREPCQSVTAVHTIPRQAIHVLPARLTATAAGRARPPGAG